MQHSQYSALRQCFISLGVTVALVLAPTAGATAHEKILYRFTGGTDGASPSSSLALDASGHLYGTTSAGGNTSECIGSESKGCGVVFELTSSQGKWQESVLYEFQGGADGWSPSGNLLFDAAGNIYGTTLYGGTGTACGTSGCGTVFELSSNADGSWTETVLHSFEYGFDGAFPAGLTADASGRLFGVTTSGQGIVYELSPSHGGTWKETLLCSTNGSNPGLALKGQDNFYFTQGGFNGDGSVSEVKRIDRLWHELDLYDFQGGGNGGEPMAGVTIDKYGNLYGTGRSGGNDFGIAFELKRSAGQWKESMLHNFCSRNNCADGARPQAPLVFDQAGNLYGTTANGGTGCTLEGGCGVVFKLAHTKTGWTETVLHSFKYEPDGSGPTEGLTLDGNGNLFGTTPAGGIGFYGGYGTVFEVTP
jgi:uncharacterized repeat protein (TIGR03803 family)